MFKSAKTVLLVTCVFLGYLSAAELSSEDQKRLDKIVREVSEIRGSTKKSIVFDMEVKNYKDKKAKGKVTLQSYVDIDPKTQRIKSLVVLAPDKKNPKGRYVLSQDNSMWLYKGGTRRALRISPSQRLLGEASNVDVAGVDMINDYTVIRFEEKKIGKRDITVLRLKKKADSKAPYFEMDLWVNSKDSFPVKVDYFSRSKRKIKTLYYKDVKKMLDRQRPTTWVLVDALNEGFITYMHVKKMKYKKLSPSSFKESSLSTLKL